MVTIETFKTTLNKKGKKREMKTTVMFSGDMKLNGIENSFGRHMAIANFVFRWLLHGVFLTSIKNRDIDMMKILLEYDADLAWDVEKKKWASPSQCKSNIRLSQLGGGGSYEDL